MIFFFYYSIIPSDKTDGTDINSFFFLSLSLGEGRGEVRYLCPCTVDLHLEIRKKKPHPVIEHKT
jgi:hypothetical protein